MREVWRLSRAEGISCKVALVKGLLRLVEGDLVLLGSAVLEGRDVAPDDVG